jgi:hypothetical protein
MGVDAGMCELEVDQFRHVATAASAARANFYVMQPADVGYGHGSPARPTLAASEDRGSDNPLEGIEHLAGCHRRPPALAGCNGHWHRLLRVAKESAAYYVAEIEPFTNDAGGRSRSAQRARCAPTV